MNRILVCFLLSITVALGQSKKAPSVTAKPLVLGLINELASKELMEMRKINVYLPDSYTNADTTRYPVIYLLDGSADEDFIHVVGLVHFNSFPWVDRIQESIVVGIATVNRRRDYTYPTTIKHDSINHPSAGGSKKFISFIENELIPFVGQHYKTNKERTLIGQSLGGLLATEILLKKPTLFSSYIIVSPSLWWDNGSLLQESSDMLDESFSQKTKIYIGVGKEGVTPGAIPRVMEVDANLLAEKLSSTKSKTVEVHFDYLPSENHATIMHQAVSNAFKLLR